MVFHVYQASWGGMKVVGSNRSREKACGICRQVKMKFKADITCCALFAIVKGRIKIPLPPRLPPIHLSVLARRQRTVGNLAEGVGRLLRSLWAVADEMQNIYQVGGGLLRQIIGSL